MPRGVAARRVLGRRKLHYVLSVTLLAIASAALELCRGRASTLGRLSTIAPSLATET
jgi:hypothetical protein